MGVLYTVCTSLYIGLSPLLNVNVLLLWCELLVYKLMGVLMPKITFGEDYIDHILPDLNTIFIGHLDAFI